MPMSKDNEGFCVQQIVASYKKKVSLIDHSLNIEYHGCENHKQSKTKTTKLKVCDLAFIYAEPLVKHGENSLLIDAKLPRLNFEAEYQ